MSERQYARKHLRLVPDTPVYARMTIVQVGDKPTRSGSARVRIINICPGGLRFVSSLKLPADEAVLLELEFEVAGRRFGLRGNVVHKESSEISQYEYGFRFKEQDEMLKICLKELFNDMTVKMGRQIVILKFRHG